MIWGAVVVVGLALLCSYANVAGELESPPGVWPSASRIPHSESRPTLVLFAHPKCPCTRASLRELERLTMHLNGKVSMSVVFTNPSGQGIQWSQTDLWSSAQALPGAQTLDDPGGIETERFRARTSGVVLLYAPTGELRFVGGITSSRGHEGASAGSDAIADIVLNKRSGFYHAPVFGCALQNVDSLADQETQ